MEHKGKRGKTFRLFIRGPNACFTRPEMKVERVSYDVPTPSAMRGVLEAIFWKPAFMWMIERIDVLNPIRWETVRRNEVGNRASPRSAYLIIEDNRQQRSSLILKNVAYVVYAYQELTGKQCEGNDLGKLMGMFERRAAKGQCFHRPYLGTREFAVEEFRLLDEKENLEPIGESRDLGWMLYDLDFSKPKRPVPLFFHPHLENGSLTVPHPESPEVKR